jgi:hypothetical protein
MEVSAVNLDNNCASVSQSLDNPGLMLESIFVGLDRFSCFLV